MGTPFSSIYDRFLGKITEDMYLEFTEQETLNDIKNILIDSIPSFEFPHFNIYDYDKDSESYNVDLTEEEIDILATLMVLAWINRQIASCENIRMKFTGSDFKMTSQANHLSKLLNLKDSWKVDNTHKQRLYGRRKINDKTGCYESTWKRLRGDS